MLNSDSRPAKPAGDRRDHGALLRRRAASKPTAGLADQRPPNISCSIGEAMPKTPMPADTFRHEHRPDQPELRRPMRVIQMQHCPW